MTETLFLQTLKRKNKPFPPLPLQALIYALDSAFPKLFQSENSQPSQAERMAEPSQIETGTLNLLIQTQNLKRN